MGLKKTKGLKLDTKYLPKGSDEWSKSLLNRLDDTIGELEDAQYQIERCIFYTWHQVSPYKIIFNHELWRILKQIVEIKYSIETLIEFNK